MVRMTSFRYCLTISISLFLLLHRFLAPGVGAIGPIQLDALPLHFKRDLLSHEAHRHPYLELFGLICLLKLRCGSEFGTRTHASLRFLATLTLMPWLKKYRCRKEDDHTEVSKTDTMPVGAGSSVTERSGAGDKPGAGAAPDGELDAAALVESNRKLKKKLKKLKEELRMLRGDAGTDDNAMDDGEK